MEREANLSKIDEMNVNTKRCDNNVDSAECISVLRSKGRRPFFIEHHVQIGKKTISLIRCAYLKKPSEEASRGNGSQNVNLPPLLAAHMGRSENGKPLQSSLSSVHGAHGPPFANSDGKPPLYGEASPTSHKEGMYHRPSQTPMYTFLNMLAYANPNSTGLFPNHLGLVTPFARWIEDYPIPDGLKMPSHIGSYDGKGDTDNFLHLFEGAIRMKKWLMPVACYMFTYTLKDSARIWWNSQKAVQIQEAINSGQLSHLVKGIKKEKANSTDTHRGEGKKDKSTASVEAPILMISREDYAAKNTISESMRGYLRALLRETKPYHQSHQNKYKPPPLVGFLRKRSWSVGEVPLEITIGEHPLSRTETLNFAIVKSDSPHNMLLGRTAMQKMGIVVSTIHGAIKFHTKKGVRTVHSVGEAEEETKKARRTLTFSKERILSCDDTEEKIVVNNKYPEQMVTIGKQ
ncbi:hypothetical protein Tco_0267259 [Tanacetum coccineum]